jgi:hypothetical protein
LLCSDHSTVIQAMVIMAALPVHAARYCHERMICLPHVCVALARID